MRARHNTRLSEHHRFPNHSHRPGRSIRGRRAYARQYSRRGSPIPGPRGIRPSLNHTGCEERHKASIVARIQDFQAAYYASAKHRCIEYPENLNRNLARHRHAPALAETCSFSVSDTRFYALSFLCSAFLPTYVRIPFRDMVPALTMRLLNHFTSYLCPNSALISSRSRSNATLPNR